MSVDPFPSQGAFAKELEVQFPLLSDWPSYKTAKDYQVWRESPPLPARVTYVIDKEGIIRKVYLKVNTQNHPEEVLAYVKENLTDKPKEKKEEKK